MAEQAPGAGSLLDLGCGTARGLEALASDFDCTGIDIQPQMIAYAQQARPGLDLRTGDMCSFRLGRTVDVVLSAGSALAYLHDAHDLRAAFATFAAHAHLGTLLVICTQIAPIQAEDLPPLRIDAGDLHATQTTSFTWDPTTRLNTMHRHWHMDDGTQHHDTITWHIISPMELEEHATNAGFHPLETFASLDTRCEPLDGAAVAWFVASYEG